MRVVRYGALVRYNAADDNTTTTKEMNESYVLCIVGRG